MPELQGIRSSSMSLIQPLLESRYIKAIVLGDNIKVIDTVDLVRGLGKSSLGGRLESLVCDVDIENAISLLDEIALACPRLQHLCMALSSLNTFPAEPVTELHQVN